MITSGQVMQACALIERFNIPNVYVETNGVGAFVPQLLKQALKQERLRCGVTDVPAKGAKNDRILAGLEAFDPHGRPDRILPSAAGRRPDPVTPLPGQAGPLMADSLR